MGSLIIALPKIDDAVKISNLLQRQGIIADAVCQRGADVLVKVSQYDYGIVVCSNRLQDMNSVELYEYLPDCYEMVIISSDNESQEDGIVRLCNPFKISNLISTLEFLSSQQHRKYRKRNDLRKKRVGGDNKIIDRAKQVLMERNDMTEPEAYRYIQKCSMDSATNISETASMILMLSGIR